MLFQSDRLEPPLDEHPHKVRFDKVLAGEAAFEPNLCLCFAMLLVALEQRAFLEASGNGCFL
jgi:hypothetical protein